MLQTKCQEAQSPKAGDLKGLPQIVSRWGWLEKREWGGQRPRRAMDHSKSTHSVPVFFGELEAHWRGVGDMMIWILGAPLQLLCAGRTVRRRHGGHHGSLRCEVVSRGLAQGWPRGRRSRQAGAALWRKSCSLHPSLYFARKKKVTRKNGMTAFCGRNADA